ncbi:MAG: low temperature requirement protein A [Actinobacteria bacterium]|nr:MAG: low temperature requirement protein A [Actinomycetota bacterium]
MDPAEPLVRAPRLRVGEAEDRRATWFEVFFDLVFVVAISELAEDLAGHLSYAAVLRFAGLFVPVWWAWVLFTYYADRLDTDDIPYRLIMLAAMVSIAALAVNLSKIGHGGDPAFVAAYLCIRALVVLLYARAGRHEPLAKRIAQILGIGSGLAALVWGASLAVSPPVRWWLWALAVTMELSLPFVTHRLQRDLPPSRSHIPERFGLFTIIVLGQAVIDVVAGTTATRWTVTSTSTALLAFLIAASLWWLYFDFLPAGAVARGFWPQQVFTYGHAPLLAGVVAMGVGTRGAIGQAGASSHLSGPVALLLGGGAACYLIAGCAIQLSEFPLLKDGPMAARMVAAAGGVLLAVVGGRLPALVDVVCLVVLLAGQVVIELTLGRRPWRQERLRQVQSRGRDGNVGNAAGDAAALERPSG